MNIITITLSPAFDVHCSAPALTLYKENLAEITSTDVGGKGINISRALTLNQIDNLAFVILGDENGESFERALSEEGIKYRELTIKGRIRENITCHTDGAPETRISFKGFSIDNNILKEAASSILPDIDKDTIVTFTGRVPSGVEMDEIKSFLRRFTDKGARLVIDSRSFSLEDLKEMRPWLIKPNQEEISEYLGREINGFDEIKEAAAELYRDGIENVMISLGGDGAMLVCKDGTFIATPPKINAISTIGAGDSSIAGFIAAAQKEGSAQEMLKNAVAFGSAACLTEGTKPPLKKDIEKLIPLIKSN